MPNGMEMTEEEFIRLNKPLLGVDTLWNRFAKRVGGRIIYNYHSRPERRIILGDPVGFNRAITLACVTAARDSLGQPLGLRYFLDIWAAHDTDEDRTYWVDAIARLAVDQVNPETLEPLLDRAWERLKNVDMDFLRRHGKVSKFPPGRVVYPKDQMVAHPSYPPDDRARS